MSSLQGNTGPYSRSSEESPVPANYGSIHDQQLEDEQHGTLSHRDSSLSSAPSSGTGCCSWRRHWVYATVMLCCYGFFKEFKPSEPFLNPYLVSPDHKNFSQDDVNDDVYPYWPYSFLVAAFITFLLTDLVRYKPVILVESGAYLLTRVLLIWGTSIGSMQWMQVAYGVASATEIAYFSYIYAAVSVVHFKKVTSYVRAIRLFGQSMAGVVGQILISTKLLGYRGLNYISFGSVLVACVISVLLPDVYNCSCTTTHKHTSQQQQQDVYVRYSVCDLFKKWLGRNVVNRARDFIKFYTTPSLLKWSVWWALAMCGWLQVGNYVQSLWQEVGGSSDVLNGLVEALATLCSAGAAFVLSFLKVNWPVWGEVTIGVLSLLDAAVLMLASSANVLWLVYLCHILYRTTYAFLITIASVQLAMNVDHESYALIFGFNTFLALVFQTILTLVVSDKHGLNLYIRTQFVVYSGYYYVLTLVFIGAGVYKLTSTGWLNSLRIFCQDPPRQSQTSTPGDHEEHEEAHQAPNPTIQEDDSSTSTCSSISKLV